MRTGTCYVTPETAKEWLTHNKDNNRKLMKGRVEQYANDIKAGKWELNGETIKFNKKGDLIDGQHRLQAVVEAGVACKFLVVWDVDANLYMIDRGAPRSAYQSLNMHGLGVDIKRISVANTHIRLTHGGKGFYTGAVSDKETERTLEKHRAQIDTACRLAAHGKQSGIMRVAPTMTAVFHALLCGADTERLDSFCEIVNTGVCTKKADTAAIAVRTMLENKRGGKGSTTERYNTYLMTISAISDFVIYKARSIVRPVSDHPWYQEVRRMEGENGANG